LFLQLLVNDGRAAVSPFQSDIDDADALPLPQQLDGFAREELALDRAAGRQFARGSKCHAH
jgi:hypothetical protein